MIMTVGHSNVSLEEFIYQLKEHQVKKIIDVRFVPYSKHVPHFNQHVIKPALIAEGIAYIPAGHKLGNSPSISQEVFLEGVKKVMRMAETEEGICLMCSEKDYQSCHRYFLITNTMKKLDENIDIVHLVSDQRIYDNELLF
jgi:uncharacterized protein (DUF488 family)